MSILQHPHPHAGRPLGHRAWIAVALTPVGLVVAVVAGFAGGKGTVLSGAVLSVLVMAAPAAGVALGVMAARAGEPSTAPVLAVAAVLLALTALALPLIVVSGTAFAVAVAVCLGVAAVAAVAASVGGRSRPV